MISVFGTRLKKARLSAGLSCMDVAEACGVTVQTIYKYESGKLLNPSQGLVRLCAKACGVEPSYLLGETEYLPKQTLEVPILQQRFSAGGGEEFSDEVFIGIKLPILGTLVRGANPDKLYAAEVRGDSMSGINLIDGDYIIFALGEIKGNGIYAIQVDDEVFVKRLEFDPFSKQLTIISENPNYKPKTVDPDRVRILGRVISWVHRNV